jgi:hypothetical protein
VIGFSLLGRYGLLGNQMFQYAALRGIAAHRGFEFCIPRSSFRDRSTHHQLFEAFKLEGLQHIRLLLEPTVQERHYHFDNDLFDSVPDNHNILGYLQTEKYFVHIADDIRADFQFRDDILEPCAEYIQRLDDPVSLHVRRGDYVNNVEFATCTRQYYDAALSHFDSERPVIVFSDEPDWCRREFQGLRFTVSSGHDNVTDMCLMSLCRAHIIANSSFSWWGAWLANSDAVYAPKDWFGTEGYTAGYDTSDLIPGRWNRI